MSYYNLYKIYINDETHKNTPPNTLYLQNIPAYDEEECTTMVTLDF